MSQPQPIKLRLLSDGRIEAAEPGDPEGGQPSEEAAALVRSVLATISRYIDAATDLANGKYAAIKNWIAPHLAAPSKLLAIVCPEGVILRYERSEGQEGITGVWLHQSLFDLAPIISQNVVFCYPDRNFTSLVPTMGMQLTVQKVSGPTAVQDLLSVRIGLDAALVRPPALPVPPSKPFCPVSVQNWLELCLGGELVPALPQHGMKRHLLLRSHLTLPVLWERIEIYPFVKIHD